MSAGVRVNYISGMRVPRWLVYLVLVTLVVVLVPLIGMVFPALEVLRGFMLTWIFVWFAWVLVGFYHALKFLTGGK